MRFRSLAVFLVIGSTACHDSTRPEGEFRIEAQLLTHVIEAGDSLAVRVTAVNPTSHPVTVTSPSSCHFSVRAVNETNENVGYSDSFCFDAFTPLTVAARSSVSAVVYWRSLSWNDGWTPVPSGTYRIRGVLFDGTQAGRLSAPVSFQVR